MVTIGQAAVWAIRAGADLAERVATTLGGPLPVEASYYGSADVDLPQEPVEPELPARDQPVEQWGLKVPNGNIVWDNALYCGNPLGTPEQRSAVLEALIKTAHELGFTPEDFLKDFGWVRRVGVHALAWSDASLTPLIQQQPEPQQGVNGHPVDSVDVSVS